MSGVDPNIAALQAGLSGSGAGPVSAGVDPNILALQKGLAGESVGSSAPAPSAPIEHHAPTRFQQASVPPPASAPELSWGQTLTGAAQNAIPSAVGVGKSMLDAVTHPAQTVHGLAQLGRGVVGQVTGSQSTTDPQALAVARALEQHYSTTYGSVKGFKQAVSTDPASVAMDASTALDGLGAVAKGADLGALANLADKASSAVDPVANAVRLATAPARLLSNPVTRAAQSVATGVPMTALKLAKAAGETTDPALRDAFMTFHQGDADPLTFLDATQQAMKARMQRQSQEFMDKRATMAGTPVGLTNTQKALQDAVGQMNTGATGGWGAADHAAMNDAWTYINDVANRPPSGQTLDEVNALKQQMYQLGQRTPPGKARNLIQGPIYHGVRADLVAANPQYADLMEQWQRGIANIDEIKGTLGLRGKAPVASATLMKSIKAMGKPGGEGVLNQLAAEDPRIPFMLAGAATSSWTAGLGHNLLGAVMEQPWLMAMSHANPVAAGVGIGANLAATSPRIAGALNYGAGRLGTVGADVAGSAPVRGAYYAGRAEQAGVNPNPTPTPGTGQLTPPNGSDADAATRMVLAEAGNQPAAGKLAALFTAINRAKRSGRSVADEINAPGQYEGVDTGVGAKFDPSSPEYQSVMNDVVAPAFAGQVEDPTGGMTHFINKDLQRKLGRSIPKWAENEGLQIGAHTFYRAEGGRVERAGGGKVDDIEPLIARLLAAVEHAKKAETASTKPLLRVPDGAVARALEVAGKAI